MGGRKGGHVNSEMETESYGSSPLALFSAARANAGTDPCLVSITIN